MSNLKLALCQMKVIDNKKQNIQVALDYIKKAKSLGADVISLPEIFNCPYDCNCFKDFSEEFPNGETIKALSDVARSEKIILIGGSIPEYENGKIYNTSFIFNSDGSLICKHRKAHLFDIDIKDKITFKESDALYPGDKSTVFDTPFGKIGVAICYDIRFPELFRDMVIKGAKLIIVPAAFNMTTGPAHWELNLKSRALDNQTYIAGVSPARNPDSSYIAYGYSSIVSPWGDVICQLDEKEGLLMHEIDLDYLDKVRNELPLLKHRRPEIYNT